jgi:hypothetical protein
LFVQRQEKVKEEYSKKQKFFSFFQI